MLKIIPSHPLTHGFDSDSPETSELRKIIIQEKRFLNRIYQEWYHQILEYIPNDVHGQVLELGSGGGFLGEIFPEVIKSDIIFLSTINAVVDAHNLPFKSDSLRAIVMTNVFHHIPHPVDFFRSAVNCICPGGRIIMIEPWVSTWSQFVYSKLHQEPFDPNAIEWQFPPQGPLSGANSAMPWILFHRDKDKFFQTFPEWSINHLELMMPVRYLLSGGVSFRGIMPNFTYYMWKWIEGRLDPVMSKIAMFAFISLERKSQHKSSKKT
jgi:SAM-dependent methyltransferase